MSVSLKENWKIALWLTVCVIGVNLPLIFGVGFLSDDWNLLYLSQTASVFAPMEHHHFSPFVTAVFKFMATSDFSPAWIHLLAFLIHGLNIYLVLQVCDRLTMGRWEKWVVAALFALSPAGFEALAWCCAIGYLLCTTWILAGLSISLSSTHRTTYQLAVLQLLAFATWDWAILLTPVLASVRWFYLREYNFKGLVPVSTVWCVVLCLKIAFGMSLGYETNSPLTVLSHLGSSLVLTVWPEFSRSFYASFWGIALAVVTILVFFGQFLRDRIARMSLILFFVSLLPVAFLGYPQSRYTYLASIFLYCALGRMSNLSILRRIAAIAYIVVALFWTVERRDMWIEADVQARDFRKKMDQALEIHEKITVADVPERVRGFNLIWLPTVWRPGQEHFGSRLQVEKHDDGPGLQ